MVSEFQIGVRERRVLTAIIESYIATGEPVASQSVARDLRRRFGSGEGMSAATIRNTMAALDEAGWLDQPHASSGRIPAARAFRFYVDQLIGAGRLAGATANLAEDRREQIDESFAGVESGPQFLERTSHVLALLSGGVGLGLAASSEAQTLEHIHFSRLSAARVLAVVVTISGAVQDRVLRLDRDMPLTELEASARYLNENFHGWFLERIHTELDRRIALERSEYNRLMQSVNELYRKGALESEQGAAPMMFVEGMANLLAGEMDRERLRRMLTELEAKQRIIELLTAYVDASQPTVRVVVGLEDAIPGMQNLVLIGSPVRMGTGNVGTVAVIGPTRMQYGETMSAVAYIAQLSGRLLQ